jgi:hypothetical protein
MAIFLGVSILLFEAAILALIVLFFVGRAKAKTSMLSIEDPEEEEPEPAPQPKPPAPTPLPTTSWAPSMMQRSNGTTLRREMSGDQVVYVGDDGDVYVPITGADR